ncbi:MAG: DUF3108 domain-containing protein [Deltaproteobacteria bacterium]|nr:DUF3108 domain-containing protein [Deltaproteobacteria bacterium]
MVVQGIFRKHLYSLTALLLFVLLHGGAAVGQSSRHEGGAPPFKTGERLSYQLRWGILPAGTVVLEVLPMETVSGVTAHHFAMTATSSGYVDLVYPVRDRVDAYADLAAGRSLLYRKKQREGRHRRDETVRFDWTGSRAAYENFGKKRNPIPVGPGTFDPLSVFYAFRMQEIRENIELHAPVSDGKKCVTGVARVRTREKIRLWGQELETYLVEPDLKHVGGVFRKSDDAALRVWVTADEKKIPVRIASRVALGSFVADLVPADSRVE